MNDQNNSNITSVFQHLSKYLLKVGVQLSYTILLLFYAYLRKDTPKWAKNIIIGALAYFVAPIDGIPDLSPFIGFTDDLGVMMYGLVAIACYVNDEVRLKARAKLATLFDDINEEELAYIDAKI